MYTPTAPASCHCTHAWHLLSGHTHTHTQRETHRTGYFSYCAHACHIAKHACMTTPAYFASHMPLSLTTALQKPLLLAQFWEPKCRRRKLGNSCKICSERILTGRGHGLCRPACSMAHVNVHPNLPTSNVQQLSNLRNPYFFWEKQS